MHHKKCKNGGFRAFSLKQNVVIAVQCEDKKKEEKKDFKFCKKIKVIYIIILN